MTVRIATQEEIDAAAAAEQAAMENANANVNYQHGDFVDQEGNPYDPELVNRNAPCPCGSGEKFKHCHGRVV